MTQLASEKRVERIGNLLTLREAARVKQVKYDAFRKWVYRSQVPVVRVGRSILLNSNELSKYRPTKFIK